MFAAIDLARSPRPPAGVPGDERQANERFQAFDTILFGLLRLTLSGAFSTHGTTASLFAWSLWQTIDRRASRKASARIPCRTSTGSGVPLQVDLNVTVALILLTASALLGLVAGLFFRVSILLLLSVLIAIIAAISLHAYGFGFAGGVSITIGCIVICQITYIAASVLMSGSYGAEGLTQQEIDDGPNRSGEHDIRREDE